MFNNEMQLAFDSFFSYHNVAPANTIDISSWYCVAQWACRHVEEQNKGSKMISLNEIKEYMHSDAFIKTCELLSVDDRKLKSKPIPYLGLHWLCSLIYKYNLTDGEAMSFYLDYLAGSVSNSSLFSDLNVYRKDGPLCCSLIHLAMVYAGDTLGKKAIISLLTPTVYDAHRAVFDYLGVSYDNFELFWHSVHYLDGSSPMQNRPKIEAVLKVYRKMKAPESMLFEQYALARHFTPKELRGVANPWEYAQKAQKRVIQEAGMSADEKLFNEGAYQISREEPTDAVQAIFYKDSRDDSKIESALVRSEMNRLIRITSNNLIVNPSPAFLVECAIYWSDLEKPAQPEMIFAVNDDVVAYLYGQQYPQFRFILIDQLDTLRPEFDHVVILARDHEMTPLWKALSLSNDEAHVTMLVPQSAITLKDSTFASSLRENRIYVNWIMDVPDVLASSKPKKKMLLSCRKGNDFANEKMHLLFATTCPQNNWIILDKESYAVPAELLFQCMTLSQMRSAAIKAIEKKETTQQKDGLIYDFSNEIKVCYNFVYKSGKLEAARAYYRKILRPESGTTSSKGKRPKDRIDTELGLRGKSEEEIVPNLKYVPFYDEYCNDIVADIRDYYKADLSRLTVKTMWFCCRSELQSRISYDEVMAKEFFCGADQTLSNLVSGVCLPDDIIRAMTPLYGENGAGKKQWLQLYLIFQVAVDEGFIVKNPLASFLHVVKDEDRKRLYMLNAALKKSHFSDAEEARMVAYMRELIPLSGKKKGMAPRYVVESKWLSGAFSLFAGIPIREICPLTWGDLHYIEDCVEEMQIYITKHLNSNGVVVSNVNYGNKEHFRKVALALILTYMLLQRKRYLMDFFGYTEEILAKLPIMLDIEPSGRGRKKHTMISRSTALKVNKQLLDVADIPKETISLLEGEDQFDVNLNAYRNDLFAANFRHKAYHTCGFTAGELSHHVGNKGPDTFSRHYCDYGSDFLQYDMCHKLYRWTYIYDEGNDVTEPFCIEEVLGKEQEYTTGRFAEGRAYVDLTLKPSHDAEGTVRIEVECEHGLDGTAVGYSKGGAK